MFLFYFILIILGTCPLETFGTSKKNREISGLVLPPASGKKPDSIIVLFHGYGDNAENFLLLGALLGQAFPNTIFAAVEGPLACKAIPFGKQWFRSSKNNHSQLLKEIKTLTPFVNQYLTSVRD